MGNRISVRAENNLSPNKKGEKSPAGLLRTGTPCAEQASARTLLHAQMRLEHERCEIRGAITSRIDARARACTEKRGKVKRGAHCCLIDEQAESSLCGRCARRAKCVSSTRAVSV